MPDNKNLRGQKDRSRIDANDATEVEYVHHQFPWLSHQEIRNVIKAQGPDRDAVLTFLERKSGSAKVHDELY